MNKLKYISMATMVILMVACSNEDTTIADNGQGKVMTLTTTLRMVDDASTRTLTDDGTQITATWAQGEEFQISYEKTTDPDANNKSGIAKATVASVSAGTATVTATLTDAKDGGAIDFSYPYNHADPGTDHNTDQIGTLADINANFACMYGSGTMSVSGNTVSINDGGVAMTQEISIWKFTFSDGTNDITSDITNLKISFGNVTYDVNPTSQNAIYVAIYDAFPYTTGTTTITATTASGTYSTIKPSVTLQVGQMYTSSGVVLSSGSPLKALKAMINSGTDCSSYIGYEVNSDGNIAASGVSGTHIGYIGYISTTDVDTGVSGSRILVVASSDDAWGEWGSKGTSRGLTTDGPTGYSFTNTLQAYGNSADTGHPAAYNAWNHSATIPTGGATPAHWFLPTQNQLNSIITAVGGFSQMTKIGWYYDHHWTSTEYNADYAVRIDNAGKFPDAYYKETVGLVRACFAY